MQWLLIILLSFVCSACGQSGQIYLSKSQQQKMDKEVEQAQKLSAERSSINHQGK